MGPKFRDWRQGAKAEGWGQRREAEAEGCGLRRAEAGRLGAEEELKLGDSRGWGELMRWL